MSFRHTMLRLGYCCVCVCIVILSLALLSSCSTKKNTSFSRNWQAFTTRYNVYYNGSEHYKEQLKTMESGYEDDFTRMLLLHPAEARADNKLPQPSGDFKRTIEKMQKAIQLHSIKKKPAKRSGTAKDKAFRAREEFNPFLHNAWMMMGRAQFFNGDFLGAASTFFYVSKHFNWLPDVVTEALLWQARCYCALDWSYEAENILGHIKDKQLTNKQLRSLYNNVESDYLIREGRYEEVIPYLQAAAASANSAQKTRLWFLLGQVYTYLGQNQNAYAAYKKAGSGNGTAYRTKFNARIKQSEVYIGSNIKKEVSALRSMVRFERNKEYLDQIYYAIGNLYLSHGDTAEAKKNYSLAVEKSTRSGIEKALAQLALGNILFEEKDYVKAQPCYSEAVPVLPESYPGYKQLRRRSDVLDELALYAGNVELQDSLLDLSKLPEEEQMKVCERLAEELKKKEKEEEEIAKREEYLAQQAAQGSGLNRNNRNTPTQYQLNTDKSWYFYNTTVKNAGKTEFQKRWGARRLEDDWRRRNKATFSFEPEENDEDDEDSDNEDGISEGVVEMTEEEKTRQERESDPHFAEYYLKQIPKTEAEVATCNEIIQEGLYNMGVILKDKLEDYSISRAEFLELESRYPDNIYRLDVYYNMYLMAVRDNDSVEAEKYRQLILDEFPESAYGQAMRDPAYFDNLRLMNERQEEMYARAYEAYISDDNAGVHALTEEMEKNYPLSKILPKFVFIDALSYVTEKDYDKFKERLTELLQKWPETDMTPMASDILRGLAQGRKPQAGLSNNRGMLWEIRLTNDSLAIGTDGQPAAFDLDPEKPQLLVLAFPMDSVSSNQLLYDVARHNFSSFVVKDFDLETMNFSNVGLIIIKGFDNMRELEHYRSVMERNEAFLMPPHVRPIMISVANFELLLREGRSFEEYFRYQEDETVRQREEEIIGSNFPDESDETDSEEQPKESIIQDEESTEAAEELPTEEPENEENNTEDGKNTMG